MPPQENRKTDAWTVANAKAHLSEVIERAQTEPQMITRNGTPSVVMVSVGEWNRKTTRSGSLASFLMSSPLSGSAMDDDRLGDAPRPLEL
jgi:prevent-host-death family protein